MEEIQISSGTSFAFLPVSHKLALAKMQGLKEICKLGIKLPLVTLGSLIIRVYQNKIHLS